MHKAITAAALALALPALAGAAADGAKLYEKHCLKCHGAKGAGDGKASKILKPKPTDFTQAKWQGERTDEQISDATKEGAKATKVKVGKKMPAYGKKMNDEEIQAVVKVVRGFGVAK